jgi:hypothetical protein
VAAAGVALRAARLHYQEHCSSSSSMGIEGCDSQTCCWIPSVGSTVLVCTPSHQQSLLMLGDMASSSSSRHQQSVPQPRQFTKVEVAVSFQRPMFVISWWFYTAVYVCCLSGCMQHT